VNTAAFQRVKWRKKGKIQSVYGIKELLSFLLSCREYFGFVIAQQTYFT
jgi:hypothetical protein